MELAATVFVQVVIMMLLIAVGLLVGRLGIMDGTGRRQISELLLYVVTPAVIVNAYFREFDASLLNGLLWSFLLAVVSHAVMIPLASLIFLKNRKEGRVRLERFCTIYSNCGFMALPLVQSLLGETGVFYASAYITVFNLLSWTHGTALLSGDPKNVGVKRLLLNPIVISVAVGLLVFFCQIPLPQVLTRPVGFIADLNTPLAMITIGLSLSELNLVSTFTDRRVYGVAAVRLLLMPCAALVFLRFLPLAEAVLLTTLIEIACPTGATSVMWSTKYGLDAGYASKIVSVSTILSVITIPFVVFLFQLGR